MALTTDQVDSLTTAQIVALSTAQFAWLETADIAALTTAQVRALTTDQIVAFTTEQIEALQTQDIAAMTMAQYAAFETQDIQAMSTAQINALMGVTPIVLDLDGNGITTTAAAEGVSFDLAGNGQKAQVGWVGGGDGLLVRDLNGDGVINDGRELFGIGTQLANGQRAGHGYDAMADLDGNKDGRLDAQDAAFSQLKVWKDVDLDGQTDAGELQGLVDLGIVSLDLNYALTSKDSNGNHVAMVSSYTTADGQQHQMADVLFAKHPPPAPPALDELLAAPPDTLCGGPPAPAPAAPPSAGQASHVAWVSHSRTLLDDDRPPPLI